MAEKKDWINGYLTALHDFAWWKDGEMYVGIGVYTYKEIKDRTLRENGITESELYGVKK